MNKQMIATLTAEHLATLEMLDKLEGSLERIRAGQSLDGVREQLLEFSQFMEQTRNQHFSQEEESLYPKLVKDDPQRQADVDNMVNEHRTIEQAHNSLKEELLGDNPSPEIIVDNCSVLAEKLEQHIQREHDALSKFK